MHSFLLIGQSNMAGRGFIADAIPVDNQRIYTLRNGRWLKMFRPINPDRHTSGVSLAESFAEKYAAQYDTNVGLICCADGGTSITQWMPGGVLYENALLHAKLAQRTSTIVGVLWHQGESDCTPDRYPAYKENLHTMLTQLRKDLNLPEIPILVGGLGDYLAESDDADWQLQNYPKINDALKAVSESMEQVAYVPAEGLTCNPDYLHFDSQSLYQLGLRYFAAFEAMAKVSTPTEKDNVTLAQNKMECL